MIRTQIQLEEGQYRRLKSLALKRHTSLASLIRDGVERVLSEAEHAQRMERFAELAGAFADFEGATDLAERHDAYLADVGDDADDLR